MKSLLFVLGLFLITFSNGQSSNGHSSKKELVFSEIGGNDHKDVIILEFENGNTEQDAQIIQELILNVSGVQSGNFSLHEKGYVIGKIVTDKTVFPSHIINAIQHKGYKLSDQSLTKK